jgi:hypothetical protein
MVQVTLDGQCSWLDIDGALRQNDQRSLAPTTKVQGSHILHEFAQASLRGALWLQDAQVTATVQAINLNHALGPCQAYERLCTDTQHMDRALDRQQLPTACAVHESIVHFRSLLTSDCPHAGAQLAFAM